LTPVLDQIEQLSSQLREYDKRIEQMSKTEYAHIQLIRQIPGVGAITSMAFTLTIDDPHRFGRSRDIGGYLGLPPRRGDSGDSKPQLSITKAGDHMVRRLLVGCAHYILGHFGPTATCAVGD
jgi:transposase